MAQIASVNCPQVTVLPDGRLAPKHAAVWLGVAEKTLAIWRCVGRGPKFVKVGGRVFYFQTDLESYVDKSGRLSSTAHAKTAGT
jgi:hypothetical protein